MIEYTYVFLEKGVLKSKYFKLNTPSPFKGEICGIRVDRKDYGELYFMIDFGTKLPYDIKKYIERTESKCIFTSKQGQREKGIYRRGKITAELDLSTKNKDWDYILTLKGPGYCLKEIEELYYEIGLVMLN